MMIVSQTLMVSGATTNVFVGAGGTLTFSPKIVNLNTGDTIIWTWQGSFHSTTSGTLSGTPPSATPHPDGIWDSGVNNMPHSFTNSFATSGNFPFYCSVHYNSSMTGEVVVASAALPPTVSITNPPDGTTLAAPASFALAANASSSSGITNVEFFQGAASLGNVTAPPYSVAVNSLAAADYTFSAVASDNAGLTATNSVTVHVVTPVAIILSAPQFLPPGEFRFNYTATPGLSYIVQRAASLNSASWTTLGTNVAGSSPVLFDDPTASGNPGYYRVGRLPNP